MSSSQKTFHKSRRFSYISAALGLIAIAGVGAAIVQVDSLEKTYGAIRTDIARFNKERDDAQIRRDGILTDVSERTSEAEALRRAIAVLNAEKAKSAADLADQEERIAKASDTLKDIESRSAAANDAIAKAAQATKELADLRARSSDQEKTITTNQSRLDELNDGIEVAEKKKQTADDAASSSERERDRRLAEVKD
ncbi:hypothetical protein ACCT19_36505, partial [Rhizobium ruizarguesonis]